MTAAMANLRRPLEGAFCNSLKGVPDRMIGRIGHCHLAGGVGPSGKWPSPILYPGEPGELALWVVAEVFHGGREQQDGELADDNSPAGRGAGGLADQPETEIPDAEVSDPNHGGVVAGFVEESVVEPLSGYEVRPESSPAEGEGVE
jgi:hypothetical protein